MSTVNLPDPAIVVLIGPAGSGKSTWAAARYAAGEIVSSDALRAVVGTGPHDLEPCAG
jgi:predicted kinase